MVAWRAERKSGVKGFVREWRVMTVKGSCCSFEECFRASCRRLVSLMSKFDGSKGDDDDDIAMRRYYDDYYDDYYDENYSTWASTRRMDAKIAAKRFLKL